MSTICIQYASGIPAVLGRQGPAAPGPASSSARLSKTWKDWTAKKHLERATLRRPVFPFPR